MVIHISIDLDCHAGVIAARTLASRVKSLYGCPYGQTRFQSFLRGFMPLFVVLCSAYVFALCANALSS